MLAMANEGKNTNTSQFYVTTAMVPLPCVLPSPETLVISFCSQAPWLDRDHVVFGHVIEGFEVVLAMDTYGSSSGRPKVPVTISDCGEIGVLI